MSTIFISHNSADRDWAEKVAAWLKTEGHDSVYLAFHPEDGTGVGEEWQKDLYRKIKSCSVMVVLWSRESRASDWCFAEIAQARALGRDVFPLKVGDVDEHPLLYGLQFIDLTTNEGEGFDRLRLGLRRVGVDDSFKWDPTRPAYPGFLAFDQKDAAVYFGREPEIRKALNLLNQVRWQENSRLVLILGASGSGKSSLVRAGLYPRLGRDPEDWLLLEPFRPRSEPLKELAVVLAEAFEQQDDDRSWRDIEAALSDAAEPGAALVGLLEDLLRSSAHRNATVVLFIDQLEELLGHPEEHPARPFLRMLRAALLVKESPVLVLGTMRSDSLPTFQQDSSLVEIEFENVSLAPLGAGRLRQIIEGPARVADVDLEDGLVEELLADTRTGDSLPLLAFTLRELYEKYADDRLLELDEYEELGRLKGAVKRAAERAAQGLDDEQLSDLRLAFLRLVRVSEDGQYLRRAAMLSELPVSARETVERFVNRRLLIPRGSGDEASVEVAHEALFRSWDRLREWLDLDREALLVHHRVEASAALWKKEGGGTEYLWRGSRLDRALTFAKAGGWAWTQDASDGLELTQEFLEASLEARDQEAAARETQKARLREARRQKERLRRGVVVLSIVGLLTALGFSIFLLSQRRELSDTLARNYWQRARDVAETDPLLAAHLLAQALETANDPQLVRSLQVSHGSNLRYLNLEEILAPDRTVPDQTAELEGRDDRTKGARFSRDGQKVLTWGDDGIVRLWTRSEESLPGDSTTWLNEKEVPAKETDRMIEPVEAAAFGPGDAGILVWTEEGTSRYWDIASERFAVRDFRLLESDAIRDVVWHPEGSQGYVVREYPRADQEAGLEPIAFVSDEAEVGESTLPAIVHPVVEGRRRNIFGARFDRSGDRLLTWGGDGSVRLWDTGDGSEVACFSHGGSDESSWPGGARLDANEERLLTWGRDGFVRVWELPTTGPCEDRRAKLEIVLSSGVRDAIFAGEDDSRIVTWSSDSTGGLWDAASGERLGAVRSSSTPTARLGSEGRVLAWGSDSAARLWRLNLGVPAQRELTHEGQVVGAGFSPDRRNVLTYDWAGWAKVWHAADGSVTTTRVGEGSEAENIQGAVFDASGERVAIWSHSGALYGWSPASQRLVRFEPGHDARVLGARYSLDGSRVLSWSRDKTARLWDPDSGAELPPSPLEPRDGSQVAGASWDGAGGAWTWTHDGLASHWNLGDGPPHEHPSPIDGATSDEASSRLLIWDDDGKAELLDLATHQSLAVWNPGVLGRQIDQALFGPEGSILLWREGGAAAYVWNPAVEESVPLPQPSLRGATFSPQGDLIVTWSDQAATVWDVRGEVTRDLELEGLKGARIGPFSKVLLTWDARSKVSLWDLDTGHLLAESEAVRCISEARFGVDGHRVLYWCDGIEFQDVPPGVWEVPGDIDYPAEHAALELEVRTGRTFDPETQEERKLDRSEWVELRTRYLEIAARHLEECKYRVNNIYRRFYTQESTIENGREASDAEME